MMQSFFETAPHSLGDLLDFSFRFFRLRFLKLFSLAAIFAVIQFVLTVIAYITGSQLLGGFFNIVNGILGIFLNLGLITYVLTSFAGRELSIGAALSEGAGYFWSYFGMSILIGLAVFGLMIPGGLIFAFAVSGIQFATSGGSVIGYMLMILIAFLLIGVPLLYLGTRWAVAGQALVEERAGATGALGRSWALTAGHFWRCFGYFLLVGFLTLLIVYVPAVLMGALLVFFPPAMRDAAQIAINAVLTLLVALWTPFSIVALVMLYFDLRIRNEGLDVEMRVQLMEQAAKAQDNAVAP
jgi:hypothetical protein